jgi:hypothetical protein
MLNSWSYVNHRINDVIYEIYRVESSLKRDSKDLQKDISELKDETTIRLDRIEKLLLEVLKAK